MKVITIALAAALILGGVAVVDPVGATHNSCEDDPDPKPCDPQPTVSPEYICGYLYHYGLCRS